MAVSCVGHESPKKKKHKTRFLSDVHAEFGPSRVYFSLDKPMGHGIAIDHQILWLLVPTDRIRGYLAHAMFFRSEA